MCKDDMKVSEFDKEGQELQDDCYRLPCHHAFHTSCIIQSLRQNSSCPVCRDGPSNDRQPTNIYIPDDESTNSDDMRNHEMSIDPVLQHIRSTDKTVQLARQGAKEAKRQYNILRDVLRKERKQVLQQAMLKFRNKRLHDFLAAKERVRDALIHVQEEEEKQLIQAMGATRHSELSWLQLHRSVIVRLELLQPSSAFFSVRHHDPMRSTFWYS